MNPCRCGFFSDSKKQCHRIPICAQDYQTKISGPLMDRFDLVAYMSTTPFEDLDKKNTTKKETSMDIKNRVENARKRQYKRSIEWFNQPILNAHLGASMLKECQQLSDDCHGFLEKVYNHYQLSARSYHRLLKICQTIADLQEVDIVEPHHITQALQFRFVPVVG
jgi:magnesium chelatase family protein